MTIAITLRPAAAGNEGWLFDLHEAAHRALVEEAYGPWVPEEQDGFFRELVAGFTVWVVEEAGAPVGAAYLGLRDGDTWLELIEVLPARQGSGIGTEVLAWVTAGAAREGRGTRLQVHRLNGRARALYERAGFGVVGETQTHILLRHP